MKGSEENWYSLLKEGCWIDCKKHPPPNFAVGVGGAYFSYILKSDHLGALQNVYPFNILERQFSTKWQGPSPLFEWHFHKKPSLQNGSPLKTSISPPLCTLWFWEENKSHCVDQNLLFSWLESSWLFLVFLKTSQPSYATRSPHVPSQVSTILKPPQCNKQTFSTKWLPTTQWPEPGP